MIDAQDQIFQLLIGVTGACFDTVGFFVIVARGFYNSVNTRKKFGVSRKAIAKSECHRKNIGVPAVIADTHRQLNKLTITGFEDLVARADSLSVAIGVGHTKIYSVTVLLGD